MYASDAEDDARMRHVRDLPDLLQVVPPQGDEYPMDIEVLAIGHIFISLAQTYDLSLAELIQRSTVGLHVGTRGKKARDA